MEVITSWLKEQPNQGEAVAEALYRVARRRIEKVLAQPKLGLELDIMKCAGLLELGEEPLAYRQRVRQEWD